MTTEYEKMGLTFNTKGTAKTAAKLHALSCPMLNAASRRVSVMLTDIASEVEDLTERGYTVVACKCTKGL
jgi:hypothetical protein